MMRIWPQKWTFDHIYSGCNLHLWPFDFKILSPHPCHQTFINTVNAVKFPHPAVYEILCLQTRVLEAIVFSLCHVNLYILLLLLLLLITLQLVEHIASTKTQRLQHRSNNGGQDIEIFLLPCSELLLQLSS